MKTRACFWICLLALGWAVSSFAATPKERKPAPRPPAKQSSPAPTKKTPPAARAEKKAPAPAAPKTSAPAARNEPVAPAAPPRSAGPLIAPLDQGYLTHTVRRWLVARLRDGVDYRPEFVPDSLAGVTCWSSVTLRRGGRLLGTGDGGELPVVQGCLLAAEKALYASQRKSPLAADALRETLIEIELSGPRESVADGTLPSEQLSQRFHHGLDGVAVRVEQREILIRPSQLITMEVFCVPDEELDHRCDRYQIAIENLAQKLGIDRAPPRIDPAAVSFARFRATHWVETAPGGETVELVAGMLPVDPASVQISALPPIVDDVARYIRLRQLSGGLFSYEFLPGRDMYWPEQNWVRQAATTWALSLHAKRGAGETRAALDKALAVFARMIAPLPGNDRAAYVATPDHKHPLGATALVCLAMIDAPSADRYALERGKLIAAMLAMQKPDGSFRTSYPPASGESSQDYFPGEALLALAKHYVQTRDGAIHDACDKSLPFYQAYYRERKPPMFIPWQAQAWGHFARETRLRKYADFVFEMSDTLIPLQIAGRTGPDRIYNGGFDVYGRGRAGISSAVYVEGLVDALKTARAFNDAKRAAAYEKTIRAAVPFLLQLRFKPEETFFVQTPSEVLGGFRDSPADPTLRIDHSQHALAALLGAYEVLTPAGSAPSR